MLALQGVSAHPRGDLVGAQNTSAGLGLSLWNPSLPVPALSPGVLCHSGGSAPSLPAGCWCRLASVSLWSRPTLQQIISSSCSVSHYRRLRPERPGEPPGADTQASAPQWGLKLIFYLPGCKGLSRTLGLRIQQLELTPPKQFLCSPVFGHNPPRLKWQCWCFCVSGTEALLLGRVLNPTQPLWSPACQPFLQRLDLSASHLCESIP